MFYKLRKTFGKKSNKSSSPKGTLTPIIPSSTIYHSEDEPEECAQEEHSATLRPMEKSADDSFPDLEESIKSLTLRPGHHRFSGGKEAWPLTLELKNNSDVDPEKLAEVLNNSIAPILVAGHTFVVMDFIDTRVQDLGNGTVAWCDICLRPVCGTIQTRRCANCQLVCHVLCCEEISIGCQSSLEQSSTIIQRHSSMSHGKPPIPEKREALPSVHEDVHDDTLVPSPSYSSKTLMNSFNSPPTVKLTRSASTPHHRPNRGTPSFLGLLSQMSKVHSRVSTIEVSKSNYSPTATVQLREAAHAAVMTPYDLSTCDESTLRKFGIQLRVLPTDHYTRASNVSTSGNFSDDEVAYSDGFISWTWTELTNRAKIFSGNNQGLHISLPDPTVPHSKWSCTGNIRVYINFIRTVHLAPTGRPSSVFDFVTSYNNMGVDTCNAIQDVADTQGPVWLPRGVSKLLHLQLAMTTKDVIAALLSKFKIKDNPHKFALYEHTIEGEKEVSVRKLGDNECPLVLVLTWAQTDSEQFNATLLIKRLVLQENETNDIEWTAFSVPELTRFLSILNKEEKEYMSQIILKYDLMRKELQRLLEAKRGAG